VHLVPGDAAKPGPEVVAASERGETPIRCKEYFLGQVIYVIGVVSVAREVTPQWKAVNADDPPEGVAIAAHDLFDDGRDVWRFEHPTPASPRFFFS
jgi:hypothetical protein